MLSQTVFVAFLALSLPSLYIAKDLRSSLETKNAEPDITVEQRAVLEKSLKEAKIPINIDQLTPKERMNLLALNAQGNLNLLGMGIGGQFAPALSLNKNGLSASALLALGAGPGNTVGAATITGTTITGSTANGGTSNGGSTTANGGASNSGGTTANGGSTSAGAAQTGSSASGAGVSGSGSGVSATGVSASGAGSSGSATANGGSSNSSGTTANGGSTGAGAAQTGSSASGAGVSGSGSGVSATGVSASGAGSSGSGGSSTGGGSSNTGSSSYEYINAYDYPTGSTSSGTSGSSSGTTSSGNSGSVGGVVQGTVAPVVNVNGSISVGGSGSVSGASGSASGNGSVSSGPIRNAIKGVIHYATRPLQILRNMTGGAKNTSQSMVSNGLNTAKKIAGNIATPLKNVMGKEMNMSRGILSQVLKVPKLAMNLTDGVARNGLNMAKNMVGTGMNVARGVGKMGAHLVGNVGGVARNASGSLAHHVGGVLGHKPVRSTFGNMTHKGLSVVCNLNPMHMVKKLLNRTGTANGGSSSASVQQIISQITSSPIIGILPVANANNTYLVITQHGIYYLQNVTNNGQAAYTVISTLPSNVSFTYGKINNLGQLWIETSNNTVYALVNGSLVPVITNLSQAGGMAWSNNKYYIADSGRNVVYSYDYNPNTGAISNQAVFVNGPLLPNYIISDVVTYNNNVYVLENPTTSGQNAMIVEYDSNGNVVQTYTTNLASGSQMNLGSNGAITVQGSGSSSASGSVNGSGVSFTVQVSK